jgi:hypothetical protein
LTVLRRTPFLAGVFLTAFAILVFQIVQTRILSVVTWYYLAFFAISIAMLGMTAGAVWVYLNQHRVTEDTYARWLAATAHLMAISMPASVLVQYSMITTPLPTLTSVLGMVLLVAVMTTPYVFGGITISLALTRSPFPVPLVYGVDLAGAALGAAAVVVLLDVLDGSTAILAAGAIAAAGAYAFERCGPLPAGNRSPWTRPVLTVVALVVLIPMNEVTGLGFRPVMVKGDFEAGLLSRTERWNSYSRIVAFQPRTARPELWAPSPALPEDLVVEQAFLNIDGAAGTMMPRFDGTRASIDYLKYDLVTLPYRLPGIKRSAVIGVGGGRDVMSAHLFGVPDITGVELNGIFVDLHLSHPLYSQFSNLRNIPGLTLHVDEARSWFAATDQTFDLVQMSLIDTWAATGAGAFSLSENGLYTLEGWRVFMRRLSDHGVFTVSRWYNRSDANESARMIALAIATLIDSGAAEPRRHVFVATGGSIATLALARNPLSRQQLQALRDATVELGFHVLVDPDETPTASGLLAGMVNARSRGQLDALVAHADLDLSVPTDNRPFFFSQLRFRNIPRMLPSLANNTLGLGVLRGNLIASIVLVLILAIAAIAVVVTILLPLRRAVRGVSPSLVAAGTAYFSLIGAGFMFAEISLLQYFGVFLGHPIYAMSVCLFSLILSTGVGSIASGWLPLASRAKIVLWGLGVTLYLLAAQAALPAVFERMAAQPLSGRVVVALAALLPAGFLMGFGFPTGMALVERIDKHPTPWFWGINGATGVLASVIALMVGMAFGINVTMILAAACYLLLIPIGLRLRRTARRTEAGFLP